MLVDILFGIFLVTCFVCLVALLAYLDQFDGSAKPLMFSVPFLLISSVWLLCFASNDWKVKNKIVLTFSEIEYEDCTTQFLPIKTPEIDELVNLNKRFGMTFEEGYMFEVVIHEKGPYCGLFVQNYHREINRIGLSDKD